MAFVQNVAIPVQNLGPDDTRVTNTQPTLIIDLKM